MAAPDPYMVAYHTPVRLPRPAATTTEYVDPTWRAMPPGARTPAQKALDEWNYLMDDLLELSETTDENTFSTIRIYAEQSGIRTVDDLFATSVRVQLVFSKGTD